jgi:glycosyltransferase involved in cell wall biosynthesis
MIPWFWPFVRRVNAVSLSCTYRRLAEQFQIDNPILLTTFPCVVDFVRKTPAALKLYYCVDDWTQYPGLDGTLWAAMEENLLDGVDGFIATSQDLHAKCHPSSPSLYLPHGVDFSHFHEATQSLHPVPEMERIPKPIVGFFGIIAEWVDLGLVAAMSNAFPGVSFVLIGPAGVSLDPLANCPNIHYLGPKAYDDLPKYARYFDVGLIPFVLNKLTQAVNPLKLFEYYALRLPVLATRLPELERADGPLSLASTEDEFREALRHILDRADAQSGDCAVEVAKHNSWQQRAEQLSDFLAGLA